MAKSERVSLDAHSGEQMQVLPDSAVLHTNSGQRWSGVLVEVFRHPPMESPEHYLREYGLTLALTRLPAEWREGGQFQRGQFTPGTFHLLPPRTPLRYVTFMQADIAQFVIPPAFLARVAHESVHPGRVELVPRYLAHDTRVAHLALALRAELEAGCENGLLFGDALVTALAVHLLRHHNAMPQPLHPYRGGLSAPTLRRVVEYVHAHHRRNLTLTELADVAHLSQHYFARLFRQSTGVTPHQYLIRCRVERAQALLRQGRLAIDDIAQEVGFADQSHLTRHFRRLVGVTPARYTRG